jgi:hypothetical protein
MFTGTLQGCDVDSLVMYCIDAPHRIVTKILVQDCSTLY